MWVLPSPDGTLFGCTIKKIKSSFLSPLRCPLQLISLSSLMCISQKKNGDVNGAKESKWTGWKEKNVVSESCHYIRQIYKPLSKHFSVHSYIKNHGLLISLGAMLWVTVSEVCTRNYNRLICFVSFFSAFSKQDLWKSCNVGLHVSMILYLLQEYHFDPATAAIVIFLWN